MTASAPHDRSTEAPPAFSNESANRLIYRRLVAGVFQTKLLRMLAWRSPVGARSQTLRLSQRDMQCVCLNAPPWCFIRAGRPPSFTTRPCRRKPSTKPGTRWLSDPIQKERHWTRRDARGLGAHADSHVIPPVREKLAPGGPEGPKCLKTLVERMGLEPTTSRMQIWRSPS